MIFSLVPARRLLNQVVPRDIPPAWGLPEDWFSDPETSSGQGEDASARARGKAVTGGARARKKSQPVEQEDATESSLSKEFDAAGQKFVDFMNDKIQENRFVDFFDAQMADAQRQQEKVLDLLSGAVGKGAGQDGDDTTNTKKGQQTKLQQSRGGLLEKKQAGNGAQSKKPPGLSGRSWRFSSRAINRGSDAKMSAADDEFDVEGAFANDWVANWMREQMAGKSRHEIEQLFRAIFPESEEDAESRIELLHRAKAAMTGAEEFNVAGEWGNDFIDYESKTRKDMEELHASVNPPSEDDFRWGRELRRRMRELGLPMPQPPRPTTPSPSTPPPPATNPNEEKPQVPDGDAPSSQTPDGFNSWADLMKMSKDEIPDLDDSTLSWFELFLKGISKQTGDDSDWTTSTSENDFRSTTGVPTHDDDISMHAADTSLPEDARDPGTNSPEGPKKRVDPESGVTDWQELIDDMDGLDDADKGFLRGIAHDVSDTGDGRKEQISKDQINDFLARAIDVAMQGSPSDLVAWNKLHESNQRPISDDEVDNEDTISESVVGESEDGINEDFQRWLEHGESEDGINEDLQRWLDAQESAGNELRPQRGRRARDDPVDRVVRAATDGTGGQPVDCTADIFAKKVNDRASTSKGVGHDPLERVMDHRADETQRAASDGGENHRKKGNGRRGGDIRMRLGSDPVDRAFDRGQFNHPIVMGSYSPDTDRVHQRLTNGGDAVDRVLEHLSTKQNAQAKSTRRSGDVQMRAVDPFDGPSLATKITRIERPTKFPHEIRFKRSEYAPTSIPTPRDNSPLFPHDVRLPRSSTRRGGEPRMDSNTPDNESPQLPAEWQDAFKQARPAEWQNAFEQASAEISKLGKTLARATTRLATRDERMKRRISEAEQEQPDTPDSFPKYSNFASQDEPLSTHSMTPTQSDEQHP